MEFRTNVVVIVFRTGAEGNVEADVGLTEAIFVTFVVLMISFVSSDDPRFS